jgi:hypothetical protein
MKRKLDPHTIPASTNWTVTQRAEDRFGPGAAGAG